MIPKLLIVDDERGIVDMIQSYFQSQYDILTAYSGQEALQKAGNNPDLILLDINMPDIDGLTVCQKIRDYITCPILFLTARIESGDKIIGFQAGADDYMELLQGVWKKMGKALVVITHDIRIARMADRQFQIVDGILSEVTAR